MLNNLVGIPVVKMQTKVGLKLFTNTSTLKKKDRLLSHMVSFTSALKKKKRKKNDLLRASAAANMYFWGGYNSEKSRIR